MVTLNITEAGANLYQLINETLLDHEPVNITGKRANEVLLAKDDWNAINKSFYLLSITGRC